MTADNNTITIHTTLGRALYAGVARLGRSATRKEIVAVEDAIASQFGDQGSITDTQCAEIAEAAFKRTLREAWS